MPLIGYYTLLLASRALGSRGVQAYQWSLYTHMVVNDKWNGHNKCKFREGAGVVIVVAVVVVVVKSSGSGSRYGRGGLNKGIQIPSKSQNHLPFLPPKQ